jgi:manganese/zinc/iron transport system permease protein
VSAATVIVLTAMLVGVACAIPGCFLVLRRTAMMGDAISHAVLLGIVAAFALTGGQAPIPVLIGATAVGVLTVALVELVRRSGLVADDAAIGLVFPALFAVAVVAIARFPSVVHLDVEHVLYGEIAYAPLDRLLLFGTDLGYRSLWVLGTLAVVNVVLAAAFYKELKLATFDAELASTLGFSPRAVHYGLMTVVAATAVIAFDSVGSILVVGMLIVPAATAWLLTDRLGAMLVLAVAAAAVSGVGGYWLARVLDGSISGSMATVAGLVFAVAFVAAPRHGAVAGWLRRRALRRALAAGEGVA